MYPRTEYEMTEKDLKVLLDACKPTPVIFGNNGTPLGGNPQENANYAWQYLGKKYGFDSMTVKPVEGKKMRFFTAIPSETESQRVDRLQKEAEEKKAGRIKQLNDEITERQKELAELG